MSNAKSFDGTVVTAVVFVGAVFGSLTGLVYSPPLFFIGTAAGIMTGGILAKWYLKGIRAYAAKGHHKVMVWLYGIGIAVVCGILCTLAVHGVMLPFGFFEYGFDLFPSALLVGLVFGIVVGLGVGAICSLAFVLSLKKSEQAVAEPTASVPTAKNESRGETESGDNDAVS